jgi:alpha-glucosidase (family GH31 glycosyl hydrolase)
VVWLDIEYMDGYRVFTWDADRFPDPAGMLARLADNGFRVITIIVPGSSSTGPAPQRSCSMTSRWTRATTAS